MMDKPFKTIEEQIDILESRGLIISDYEIARKFLDRNNYYRVSGYSLTLRKHDVFFKNASFQNIIDIYQFDHELRHVLLKYLESIEVTVKSVYAHEFAKKYGPFGYLDAKNFTNQDKYNEIMQKAEAIKALRLPHEPYLKHFVNELQQDIPLWAFVDLLTISNISFLYKISSTDIKLAVANRMGLYTQGDQLLTRFMHHMTILRNLCAHGSRLYNRLFEQRPHLKKSELMLLIETSDGTRDNAHLYSYIFIMRRLLQPDEFKTMKDEIVQLAQMYPFVDMHYYGFRSDWKDIL